MFFVILHSLLSLWVNRTFCKPSVVLNVFLTRFFPPHTCTHTQTLELCQMSVVTAKHCSVWRLHTERWLLVLWVLKQTNQSFLDNHTISYFISLLVDQLIWRGGSQVPANKCSTRAARRWWRSTQVCVQYEEWERGWRLIGLIKADLQRGSECLCISLVDRNECRPLLFTHSHSGAETPWFVSSCRFVIAWCWRWKVIMVQFVCICVSVMLGYVRTKIINPIQDGCYS